MTSALRLGAFLLGLGVACSLPLQERLDDDLSRFNQQYRWKDFDAASRYAGEEARERFLSLHRPVAGSLQVLGTEVRVVGYDEETEEASVLFTLTYNLLPSTTVRSHPVAMIWRYREGAWQFDFPEGGFALAR